MAEPNVTSSGLEFKPKVKGASNPAKDILDKVSDEIRQELDSQVESYKALQADHERIAVEIQERGEYVIQLREALAAMTGEVATPKATPAKKGPGRPKGSGKKGPGRPKGSKNKSNSSKPALPIIV